MELMAILANWEPLDLCSCVGSSVLGWLTAVLAVGLVAWYCLIGIRWLDTARYASPSGRKVWMWLVVIFVVCSIAGYGSWVIAMWFPKTATVLRLAVLLAQNIACPLFWYYGSHQRFVSIGKYEALGEEIANAVDEESKNGINLSKRPAMSESGILSAADRMNDQALGALTRKLCAKNLERLA